MVKIICSFARPTRLITDIAEQHNKEVFWGVDAAMTIAANKIDLPMEIVHLPVCAVRNRDSKKISEQFGDALRVCLASQSFSRRN